MTDLSSQSGISPTVQRLQPSQVTSYAVALVLAEWTQKARSWQSGFWGQADRLTKQVTGKDMLGSKSLESAVPLIQEFARSWVKASLTDSHKTTPDILQAIEQDGGAAAQGLKLFQAMRANRSELSLLGQNANIINEIISSESLPAFRRSEQILELCAQQLARSDSSPRAAQEIARLYQHDPYLGATARSIVSRPLQGSNVSTSPLDILEEVPGLATLALGITGRTLVKLPDMVGRQWAKGATSSWARTEAYQNGYSAAATVMGHGALAGIAIASSNLQGNEQTADQRNPDRFAVAEITLNPEELNRYGMDYLRARWGDNASRSASANRSNQRTEIDLARLIINSESLAGSKVPLKDQIQLLQEYRQGLASANTAQSDIYTQLEQVRKHAFSTISFYRKDTSSIGDALAGRGTNCVGRTNLMIDSLQQANLTFPEQIKVGVQVYQTHIEPVLYDSSAGVAIGLVDGKKRESIESPIYHPDYLVSQVLSLSPEKTRMQERMLIAGQSKELGDYQGLEPEYGFSTMRDIELSWQNTAPSVTTLINEHAADPNQPYRFRLATTATTPPTSSNGIERFKSENPEDPKLQFYNPQATEIYNSLAHRSEKNAFLLREFREAVNSAMAIHAGPMEKLTRLSEHFEQVTPLTSTEEQGAAVAFRQLEYQLSRVIEVYLHTTRETNQPLDNFPVSVNQWYRSDIIQNRQFRELQKSLGNFVKMSRNDPLKAAQFLDQLPKSQAVLYLELIDNLGREATNIDPQVLSQSIQRMTIGVRHPSFDEQQPKATRPPNGTYPPQSKSVQGLELPTFPLPASASQQSVSVPTSGAKAYLVIEGEPEKRPTLVSPSIFGHFIINRHLHEWLMAPDFPATENQLRAALATLDSEAHARMLSFLQSFPAVNSSTAPPIGLAHSWAQGHETVVPTNAARMLEILKSIMP